jgi:serine O-acetyltransferase
LAALTVSERQDELRAAVERLRAQQAARDPEDGTLASALWSRLRREGEEAHSNAPQLGTLFLDSILNWGSFEEAFFRRVAVRLENHVVGLPALLDAFERAVRNDPSIARAALADVVAVVERDPACERLIEPILYFKGFHAIQTHRLAHWLWGRGERDFALYLQSRSSEVFQTDIHPAAPFGAGIFLDHATGLVVGETAVVDDDVSLLQNVTLGGTGKQAHDRHPKVRRDVIIGAGAKILGNIEIGAGARVAAGAVVLQSVPPGATVAGIPAKIVKASAPEPQRGERIDEVLASLAYVSFDYSI